MKNLSIILPYYKRFEVFQQALAINHSNFVSNKACDKEIVLVLDEPSEEAAVLQLVKSSSRISWRVLINRREHEWRNPARPINVGLRHAQAEFVLIMSPESLHVSRVPDILFHSTSAENSRFSVGRIHFCERSKIEEKGLSLAYEEGTPKRYYGSICAPRSAFEAIRGYDESNRTWGGDDDNCRTRLMMAGLQMEYVPRAKALHPLLPGEATGKTKQSIKSAAERHFYLRPSSLVANDEDWGREFDEVIFESST
jgi:N-terminal domain of galactosyltransferase